MSFSLGCVMNICVILNFAAYLILHNMHPCNATLAKFWEVVVMSVSTFYCELTDVQTV